MTVYKRGLEVNGEVNASATVHPNRFVKVVGESPDGGIPLVEECGAGEKAHYISVSSGTEGKVVGLIGPGNYASVETAAAVDAASGPVPLAAAAEGKGTPAAAGVIINAYAYESAGDAGYLVRTWMTDGEEVYGGFEAAARVILVGGRLKDAVADSAVTTYAWTAPDKCTLKALYAGFADIPASSGGGVVLDAKRWDKSASAEVDLLASTLDCEGLTNKEGAPCTLHGTAANLIFDEGDVLYVTVTSDNADMTDGTDPFWGAKFEAVIT